MAEIYQVNSFSSYRLKTSVSSSLMLFLMLSFRVVVCTELPCSLCVLMSIKALFHCNVAIYFYLTIFPTGLLSFLRNEGTNMSFFSQHLADTKYIYKCFPYEFIRFTLALANKIIWVRITLQKWSDLTCAK